MQLPDLFNGAPPELVNAVIGAIQAGTGLEWDQLRVLEDWYNSQDANQRQQITNKWSEFQEQIRQFDVVQEGARGEFAQKFGLELDKFAETQRQFDSQIDQQAYQFAQKFGLDPAQFTEMAHQFDVADDRQKQQFAAQLGLSYDQLNTTIQQFNVTEDRLRDQFSQQMGLDRDKFDEAAREFDTTDQRLRQATEQEFGFKYSDLSVREEAGKEAERTRRADIVLSAPRGPADFFAYTARLKGLQESGELGDFLTREIERSTGQTRQQLANTPVLTGTEYAQDLAASARGDTMGSATKGFLSRIGATTPQPPVALSARPPVPLAPTRAPAASPISTNIGSLTTIPAKPTPAVKFNDVRPGSGPPPTTGQPVPRSAQTAVEQPE